LTPVFVAVIAVLVMSIGVLLSILEKKIFLESLFFENLTCLVIVRVSAPSFLRDQ
jgi:hypothetical protein